MARAPYRSPRREAAAARTREVILQAALDLFSERGYEATTVAAIARRADVATPTVYASIGNKRELLLALFRESVSTHYDADSMEQVAAARDGATVLRTIVSGARALNEHYAPVMWIAAEAHSVDEVNAIWQEGLASLRGMCATTAQKLGDLGALRDGVDVATATTTLSTIVHPATLRTLVSQLGLSWDEAQRWMGETLARLLTDAQ